VLRKNSKSSQISQPQEEPISLPVPELFTPPSNLQVDEIQQTVKHSQHEPLPSNIIDQMTFDKSNDCESKENFKETENDLGIAAVPHSLRSIPRPPAIPRYIPFAPPLPNSSSRTQSNRKYRGFHWKPLRDLDVCSPALLVNSTTLLLMK
jgi:hypothetical protein